MNVELLCDLGDALYVSGWIRLLTLSAKVPEPTLDRTGLIELPWKKGAACDSIPAGLIWYGSDFESFQKTRSPTGDTASVCLPRNPKPRQERGE